MPTYYNQKNLILPLDMILLENGYFYKKEKCSRNHITMKNENDDLIVITRANNGHYLYFNPIDDRDRGNIYSFCKNRGVKIDDLLDESKIQSLEIKDLKHNINPSSLNSKVVEIINLYKELKELDLNKPHFLGAKRFIDDESLKPFTQIKTDTFHNACIPTFMLDSAKIPLMSANASKRDNLDTIEFVNQCGFMKYLQYPIKKENALIKQLCYGKKGLEILKSKDIKQADIKNIIVCESIIDSLSLYELGSYKSDDTLLCSTNGQISPNHCEVLNFLATKAENSVIVLGFDNDKKGQDFTQKAKEALKGHKIELKKPILKDFNDDLMVHKLLHLNKNFDKSKLETQLQALLVEPISYFLDKKNVLLPDVKQRSLNNALRAKDILAFVTPKCEGFISKNHSKTLSYTFTRMQDYENENLKRGKSR